MARRKSDSVKWTLVLVLVVFSSLVYSRPQAESSPVTLSVTDKLTNKPTETSIRYGYNKNISIFRLPLVKIFNSKDLANKSNTTSNVTNRTSRLIRRKTQIKPNIPIERIPYKLNKNSNSYTDQVLRTDRRNTNSNKNSNIKKVITKWVDNVKDEDLLSISAESSISTETDDINFANLLHLDVNHEISGIHDQNESTKNQQFISTNSNDKKFTYPYKRPRPQYPDDTQHSGGFHMSNSYVTRPNYVFTTPTPTPEITNVGYPPPWPQYIKPQVRPTTRKPINKPIYYPQYPGNNFDVTTFPPASAYTDRIVIRPEEYSADPDECPTIFLTLNNTFQGQAKEACPDLNIAVNTNVINKNVVIESDEETDTTLTDVFGLPDDESESDEAPYDYAESQESDNDDDDDDFDNEEESESASIEGLQLSNYNAANSIEAESSEPGNFASSSTALSTYSRPVQPSSDSDDDGFSFSSLIDFFRPAVGAFSWLAAINPLSFGAISFFVTPFILLLAGASGLATLFAPFVLSGRESPETFVYRPTWEWDENYKTWHLESFPNKRRWFDQPRKSTESYNINSNRATTWFESVNFFLKGLTKNFINHRKLSRKKKIML